MKVKDYIILRSESSSSLQRQVRNLLEEGWELNGNMEMNSGTTQGLSFTNFIQNMILPEGTKTMEERGYSKIICTGRCKGKGRYQVDFKNGWSQESCSDCKGRGFNWSGEILRDIK